MCPLCGSCSCLPGVECLPRKTREDKDFFDLVDKLMDPDAENRLGSEENKQSRPEDHRFFRGLNWAALAARTRRAPWRPSTKTQDLPEVGIPGDHPAYQQDEPESENEQQ